jgi:hypothetical protein
MDLERTLTNRFDIVSISRSSRIVSLILISIAMLAISINFHMADAWYLKASVLPVYIFFFVLMYISCIVVEYFSLWCERGMSFHYTRISVNALALMLVMFETGTFFGANQDAYSHLPAYSVTSALSHIIIAPSFVDEPGI